MRSPAEIVKDRMVNDLDYTFGGVADWAVYVNYQPPEEPHKAITLNEYGDQLAESLKQEGSDFRTARVQVRVRSVMDETSTEAYHKLESILDALSRIGMSVLDPDESGEDFIRVHSTRRSGPIVYLGTDDKRRHAYSGTVSVSSEKIV